MYPSVRQTFIQPALLSTSYVPGTALRTGSVALSVKDIIPAVEVLERKAEKANI